MAPAAVDSRGLMINGISDDFGGHKAVKSRNVDTMNPHEQVHFDPKLKPKDYQIQGTDPNSKILFRDVNIIDSTGKDAFRGNVYVEGVSIWPALQTHTDD